MEYRKLVGVSNMDVDDFDFMPSHEEEVFSPPSPTEVTNLNRDNQRLKDFIRYLQWHCLVYRKTLEKIPNGIEILQKTQTEIEKGPEQCSDCEKEYLLSQLDYFRRMMQTQHNKKASTDRHVVS